MRSLETLGRMLAFGIVMCVSAYMVTAFIQADLHWWTNPMTWTPGERGGLVTFGGVALFASFLLAVLS